MPLEIKQASPELQTFFNKLLKMKKELKDAAENKNELTLEYFYEQLNAIFTEGKYD